MIMNPPQYIERAGVIGSPIMYKWDEDIAADLGERENDRLHNVLTKTHFKGKMAMATALAEWIVWRYHGHADLADPLLRIEAGWASVIDPLYTHEVEDLEGEDKGPVEGPLSLTLDVLDEVYGKYARIIPTISESVVTLAVIGQYVSPDKKIFSAWVSESLRRLSKHFPMDLSYYDRSTNTYDNSYEKPVPRDFFDSEFEYEENKAVKLLQDFLKSLDPTKNPYLNSPEEMIRKGFKGKPYTL